jgi:glycosyltransferase involved in cell wall biosynthesis
MKQLVTIIIPCKNEVDYLPKLLKSLSTQKFIADTRIIIADAGSTDGTIETVSSFSNLLNIEIIDGGLPAVARNNGAKKSSTPYLLFIDSDVTFKDDYVVATSVAVAKKFNLDILTVKNTCETKKVDLLYKLNNLAIKLSKYDKPFVTGMFMLVRTIKFNEFGGFDEKAKHCEDYLLSKKFDPGKFAIIDKEAWTDDRRFKKMGYFGMVKYMIKNFLNRSNDSYFYKDVNYWNK